MKNEKETDKEVILTFDSVSKKYNGLKALDNISFKINKGDVFGYIGPNGAGKTTTIKILVGLIRDFKGGVQINGLKIPNNINQAYNLMGYLPQTVSFQEWRTVDHALETFGRLSGMKKFEIEHRIIEILKLLNISEVRYKKISHLSGGNIQKVGFAQALLHNPEILILDEPLSGLDPEGRFFVKNTIKNLSENGITVFFSSHILSDVQDIATKIGIINHGRILAIGTTQELIENSQINNGIDIDFFKTPTNWQKIVSIEGVTTIEPLSPNRFRVHTNRNSELEEIINNLTQKLIGLNCKIRSIKPFITNLDEIYLKYIGGDC